MLKNANYTFPISGIPSVKKCGEGDRLEKVVLKTFTRKTTLFRYFVVKIDKK